MRIILRNRFKCNKCGDIIESKSRHDFVKCSCGSIFCDGGHDYVRLGLAQGVEDTDFEDLCEWGKEYPYSDEAMKLYEDVNGGPYEPTEHI